MRSPPAAFLTPCDLDRARAGEEVAELGRDQRREAAAEVGGEAEALVAGAERDHALGDAVAVGVEAEVDVDLVERAGALQAEVDRGRALDVEQRGDDAALAAPAAPTSRSSWRVALEKAALSASWPPGRVEPGRRRASVSSAPLASSSEPVALSSAAWPKTGSSKRTLGKCELAQADRHRQLGQGEGLRLGASAACAPAAAALGAAQPGDALGAQAVDVHPAAQQREPAPVDLGVVDLRARRPAVSEMVIRAIRAREESAPETPLSRIWRLGVESRFSSRLIRKPLSLRAAGVLRQRGDRHEHEHAQGCQEPLQNACPMPM